MINLERKTLGMVKKSGRILLSSLLLAMQLSFLNCSSDKKPNNPSQEENIPPNSPFISYVDPSVGEEPNRIMEIGFYDNSDNEESFEIQRKESGSNEFITLAEINGAQGKSLLEYKDISYMKPSTFYLYRIRAKNEFGTSSWCEGRGWTTVGPQIGKESAQLEADTYVSSMHPDLNLGKTNTIDVSGEATPEYNAIYYEEALLYFSLPTLPSYAKYKSAELSLNEAGGGNTQYPGPIKLAVGLLVEPWQENTVTFNNRPGSWIGTYSYGEHDPNTLLGRHPHIDVTKTYSFIYNGTKTNCGVVINARENGTFCGYYSKEGYYPGQARLLISYEW